jgi:aminoglycoside phosphotransferase (APT) family kinase protein/SAM-dependent methyltransferase
VRQLVLEARTGDYAAARRGFASEVVSGRLETPAPSGSARLQARLTGTTWEDLLQELVDPARAGWKFLLDLRAGARVLILGPSWGAAVLSLARSCAHVVVLDGVSERLELARLEAASEGRDNVTCAQVADPLRLPLADGSVDLAVVPGLPEWFAAVGRPRSRSAEDGAELLRELHRVLGPAGQAYLGFDNRRGLGRFLPRTVSFAPRALRAAAAIAGFARCRLYGPIPFRRKFHQVLDLDRSDRMNFSADAYRTRGRALRPLLRAWDRVNLGGRAERRLYPWLPAFGTVLSRGLGERPFAERLLQHLATQDQIAPAATSLARYFVRPRGVVVLVGGAPPEGAVVRLPLDPRAELSCQRHHDALATLAADPRIPPAARRLFPQPLAEGTFDGQPFFVESALAGRSGRVYYSRPAVRYDLAIVEAAEVLRGLRRATEERVSIGSAEWERLCGSCLAELRGVVGEARARALDRIAHFLERTLHGAILPLGWHHGDYDFANLLYGPGDRLTGILDFECFDPLGLPLIDLLLLLARRPIRRQGLSFGTLVVQSILPRALPPLEQELLGAELRFLGVDETLYRALALCCWLGHMRLRRDSWLVRSPSWVKANLHAVVDHVQEVS